MTQKRPLDPKFIKIATGEAGYPEDQREHLRMIWEAEGFDVPPYNPNSPSLLKKAANLGVATVRRVSSGFKNVPDEVQKARYDICKACPVGLYKAGSDTCEKCGCIMRVKSRWASERCPEGFWGRFKEGDPAPVIPSSSPLQPQPTATASQPQNEPPQTSFSSPEGPDLQP